MSLLIDPASRLAATPDSSTEPIAIVGLGCRFPGVADASSFWTLLAGNREAITDVPAERWDVAACYDPDLAAPGTTNSRRGGFLKAVDHFDARFFGISTGEATHLDPQQRLLLEVAWEALEYGGLVPAALAGSAAGVYIGMGSSDYARLVSADPRLLGAYSPTGQALSAAANRLSHYFDWRGPSLVVDTACSSSLVAVHLACQSLRAGEIELALAGGVNLILSPTTTISLAQGWMLAPDGRCKSFDAAADGYGRAEGCGLMVLKRLADAEADGDTIFAVIRGSAVNQDGGTGALTAPSDTAQQAVIRRALAQARVAPAAIDYVEAHGVGSLLTDRVEWQALSAVLAEGRNPEDPCRLGCVKPLIGHLEWAAGVASLLKAVLCLQHEEVPANPHLQQLNPALAAGTLEISRQPWPWRRSNRQRFAGVNSFGLGGTNVHLVLAEGPPPLSSPSFESTWHLLPLSAKQAPALAALAERYFVYLNDPAAADIAEICYSASSGRTHFSDRLALLGRSTAELCAGLAAFLGRGEPVPLPDDGAEYRRLAELKDLYLKGETLDWQLVYAQAHRRVVLPVYPFQRERYWLPAPVGSAPARSAVLPGRGHKQLLAYLREQLLDLLHLSSDTPLGSGDRFFELGLTSLGALELRNRLQREQGRPLPATLCFDYPTLTTLAQYLGGTLGPERDAPAGVSIDTLAALAPEAAATLLAQELAIFHKRYR